MESMTRTAEANLWSNAALASRRGHLWNPYFFGGASIWHSNTALLTLGG